MRAHTQTPANLIFPKLRDTHPSAEKITIDEYSSMWTGQTIADRRTMKLLLFGGVAVTPLLLGAAWWLYANDFAGLAIVSLFTSSGIWAGYIRGYREAQGSLRRVQGHITNKLHKDNQTGALQLLEAHGYTTTSSRHNAGR